MKKFFLLMSIVAPMVLWSCSSEEPESPIQEDPIGAEVGDKGFAKPLEPIQTLDLSGAQTQGIEGYNEFGWSTFESVMAEAPDANHSISPISINSALSLLASVENGSFTRDELMGLLGFKDIAELDDFNHKLLSYLPHESNGLELSLANSLWVSDKYTPTEEVVKSVGQNFGATVKSVDFSDASTPGLINDWVNYYTSGRIPKLFQSLDASLTMCVVNAMYLKGEWLVKYSKDSTKEGEFAGSLAKNMVDMMHARGFMRYSENPDFQMISNYFSEGKIVMDFIIPVADKVLSYAEYTELCGGVDMQQIELTLPKFKYEPEYKSMHETLFALGVPAKPYFFSRLGMAEEMEISQVIHKMYINVNEDGAEAAAVTGTGMCTSTGPGEDIPEYKIVEFNRPFYFVVREVEHDIVMVIGHVANL